MLEFDDEHHPRRHSAETLRRVARYQRWIVGVVLAQVALWVGFLFLLLLSHHGSHGAFRFPLVVTVTLGFVGGIFTFLIYCSIRNPIIALIMGAACVPPLLGILTLTVVNGVASRELRADGVPVGMFGADADAIEDVPGLYDEDEGW
ncbi:MAG TPA: hypothetical protein VLM40_01715 [Gemmata sp.]|nr:hypothetical protein [Gemmata sp.]